MSYEECACQDGCENCGLPYTPTTEDVKIRYSLFSAAEDPFYAEEDFYRWLNEHDREVSEQAWEEGWDARVNAETVTPTENPYQQG